MTHNFRRALPGASRWLVTLLASCLVLPLAAETRLIDKVVAIVDDDVILQSDLDQRVRSVTSRLSAQGTPLPSLTLLQQRVLDQLLLDNIQLQMSERSGLRVNDNELNETVEKIAQRNGMSLADFEQALAKDGLNYRDAREQIRREMLLSRLQQRRIDPRIRITDREVDTYLASAAGKSRSAAEYQIGHILIAVKDFNDPAQVAAGQRKAETIHKELKAGADFRQLAVANSDGSDALEGGVMGWRRENQLPSLIADVMPSLKVGQPSGVLRSGSGFHLVMLLDRRGGGEQLVNQYRTRHILVKITEVVSEDEARAKAEGLWVRLEAGEDFAILAKDHSDDPVSGSSGGDLGWVSPGEMVPEFEEVMTHAPLGALSKVFLSRFGWHLLQVQEIREQDISDKVLSAQARQTLYQRKYEVELQNWLREIRGEAFIQVKDASLVRDEET